MPELDRRRGCAAGSDIALGVLLFFNIIGVFYEFDHGHQVTGFGLLAATAVIVVCLIALPTRPAGRSRWLMGGVLLLAAIATLALRPSTKAMASDTGLLAFVAGVAMTVATVWLINKNAPE